MYPDLLTRQLFCSTIKIKAILFCFVPAYSYLCTAKRCDSGSVGRALASQAEGRGFESRLSLLMLSTRLQIPIIFVYVILAVLDFVPIPFPARMIFPLLWLSLCAMYQKQKMLTAALFFSFLGDVMGWRHELIPQIAFFAIAQILYIIIFSHLMPPKITWAKTIKHIILVLVALVYGIAMFWIFPRVEDNIISLGIAIYALLLLGMCYTALQHKNICLILGATLFVISDFVLGVHLFVQRIPNSTLCIMLPYYIGQLLLFIGTQKLYKLTSC